MLAWWSSLPDAVQHPSSQAPLFRSHVHLNLWFCTTQIFVGRPFIFSDKTTASPRADAGGAAHAADGHIHAGAPSSCQPPPPTTSTTTTDGHVQPGSSPDRSGSSRRVMLVEGAIGAARRVVRLCEQLHATTGLAGASYTEFSSCRAALLLLLARSLDTDELLTRDAVTRGLVLLKTMARQGNNVSAQSETSVIDAIAAEVRTMHARKRQAAEAAGAAATAGQDPDAGADADADAGRMDPHSTADDAFDDPRRGYERFKAWTASLRDAGGSHLGGSNPGDGSLGSSSGGLCLDPATWSPVFSTEPAPAWPLPPPPPPPPASTTASTSTSWSTTAETAAGAAAATAHSHAQSMLTSSFMSDMLDWDATELGNFGVLDLAASSTWGPSAVDTAHGVHAAYTAHTWPPRAFPGWEGCG